MSLAKFRHEVVWPHFLTLRHILSNAVPFFITLLFLQQICELLEKVFWVDTYESRSKLFYKGTSINNIS